MQTTINMTVNTDNKKVILKQRLLALQGNPIRRGFGFKCGQLMWLANRLMYPLNSLVALVQTAYLLNHHYNHLY